MSSDTGQTTWWQNFYRELKGRRVIRVATLYVFLFWPFIQIVDILSPALDIPAAAMRYLLAAFVLGLPIVMVLSWLYDLNKGGLVRGHSAASPDTAKNDATHRAADAPRTTHQALLGRTFERSLIGVLLVAILILSYFQYTDSPPPQLPQQAAGPAIKTIAVLPFVTFSEKQEDVFFADGLTEELLNVLSQLQSMRVIARTSSFAYKGVSKNVQEIGRELQVATILEGSVRRSDLDDTIRVTAQLIDVATGTHLWSQSFDRQFRDIFQIQDEIAGAVVEQLQVTLLVDERSEMKSRDSASPQALVAASMGNAELAKRTISSLRDAVRFFDRAIELDPLYVDAHAQLGKAHALLYSYGDTGGDRLTHSEQAIAKALELDDSSANAWAARGLLERQRGQKQQAQEALLAALDLNPNHAMAHMWLGQLQEDPGERHNYLTKAYELDPRSAVAGYNVAEDLFRVGRDAEAMDIFSRIIEADPYYPTAYNLVARINESRGRLASAIHNYEISYELEPKDVTAIEVANLYTDIGKFDLADKWLAEALRLSQPGNQMKLRWAQVGAYAARGEREQVEAILKPMLVPAEQTVETLLNVAMAGYYLEDSPAVIAAFTRADELQPAQDVDDETFADQRMHALIAIAYSYRQQGEHDLASVLILQLGRWLERQLRAYVNVDPELWYVSAQLAAIQGQPNVALQHLQRAIDEGWSQHWRPTFEPCFRDIVGTEAFQSMMAGLATRMELMGEQMEFDAFFESTSV
jgi:TolB-like protein/Tfp pilus assembly protein PilF